MLRLLVALDFSECSQFALTTAIAVAERGAPAEIIVLTVVTPHHDELKALGDLEHRIDDLRKMVEKVREGKPLPPGVQMRYTAAHGAPAHEIASHATIHQADAIVLGTHGRTGLNRLLVGSVAETVVRIAPCSVLTVKPRRSSHPG